jgi:hypothetical protein
MRSGRSREGTLGLDLWAWPTPEFDARYIGAVYLAAFVPLALFTATVMVVMLVYVDHFAFDRFHTWVFWALYLFLPVNTAVFLHRLRGLSAGPSSARSAARRRSPTDRGRT